MIISGGVNIYPAEIEGVLAGHPAVADAAVFGMPDDEFGEQVKAIVALRDGVAPHPTTAAGELVAHCRESLAGYKAPRSVDFVDEIPRTAAGKIQKRPCASRTGPARTDASDGRPRPMVGLRSDLSGTSLRRTQAARSLRSLLAVAVEWQTRSGVAGVRNDVPVTPLRGADPTARAEISSAGRSPRPSGGDRARLRRWLLSTPAPINVDQAELDDLRDRLRAHPLARARDRRRLVAGHPAGLRAGAVRALGRRLRLAAGRGRAEPLRAAALHARGRRAGHARRPGAARPVAARRRAAAGADPRLAGFGRRVPRGGRAACATRPRTAAMRPTRSTSSARRCPATGSATSRPASAGASSGSPTHGPS